ncbi:MAG: AGE family epimerase/isomerase [Planctomycetota bacterium]|nr:AGE family epimerase/isomerase [Planctomycetota bacterium]
MTNSGPPASPLLRDRELIDVYRRGLLEDTLPFWTRHAVDREHGGFLFSLDRDGTLIDSDKAVWLQCRFTWLLATLYEMVERRPEWIELARHGIDFIRRYGFDRDGRMFFWVTREGRPIRKRSNLYTECFGTMALAAYGRAAGDEEAMREALELFQRVVRFHTTPGLLEPKADPWTRRMKSLGMPMMLIVTAEELREATRDPLCDGWIERCVEEVARDFVKPELGAVLEHVDGEGRFVDSFEGRRLNPGHAIETAWFILQESRLRGGDDALRELGLRMLDWSWRLGWDEEYGGILSFRDVKGLPSSEYWHDMKFWWPQTETIIATLLAYRITGDEKYARWHRQVHDWAHEHFPDPEHGEWFGYLHRDGSVSTTLKGNLWKGPFHVPRMQLFCWKLLEEKK